MSIKKTVVATLFVSSIALASQVQAQESTVTKFVSKMVNNAIEEVGQEMHWDLQSSILSFSHYADVAPDAQVTQQTRTNIVDMPTKSEFSAMVTDTVIFDDLNQTETDHD